MGRFLIHENVPSHMAFDIIMIPREGDVIQPFKKGTFSRYDTFIAIHLHSTIYDYP